MIKTRSLVKKPTFPLKNFVSNKPWYNDNLGFISSINELRYNPVDSIIPESLTTHVWDTKIEQYKHIIHVFLVL